MYTNEQCERPTARHFITQDTIILDCEGVDGSCFSVDAISLCARSHQEKHLWLRVLGHVKLQLTAGAGTTTESIQDLRLFTKELCFREIQEPVSIAQEREVKGAVIRESSPRPAGVEVATRVKLAEFPEPKPLGASQVCIDVDAPPQELLSGSAPVEQEVLLEEITLQTDSTMEDLAEFYGEPELERENALPQSWPCIPKLSGLVPLPAASVVAMSRSPTKQPALAGDTPPTDVGDDISDDTSSGLEESSKVCVDYYSDDGFQPARINTGETESARPVCTTPQLSKPGPGWWFQGTLPCDETFDDLAWCDVAEAEELVEFTPEHTTELECSEGSGRQLFTPICLPVTLPVTPHQMHLVRSEDPMVSYTPPPVYTSKQASAQLSVAESPGKLSANRGVLFTPVRAAARQKKLTRTQHSHLQHVGDKENLLCYAI